MPIRNPFRRSGMDLDDGRPGSGNVAEKEFQSTQVVGTKPVDIKEPVEYQLSEIDDSGVFLPPSPPQRKAFWHTKSSDSTTSSSHRSIFNDNEPFNISRESFDSYRRSFDISARSPIVDHDRTRQSLDSRSRGSLDSRRRHLQPYPVRPSLEAARGIDRPSQPMEDGFEDVGLNDDQEPKPKKRGLFSRFGDNSDTIAQSTGPSDGKQSAGGHHLSLFSGRRRGQSGQGSELSNMSRPVTPKVVEISAE